MFSVAPLVVVNAVHNMKTGNWADSPFPLIPTPYGARSVANEHASLMMAQEMTHLHNCILRTLNAIYNQADSIRNEVDIRDFLLLVKFWCDELHHHHQTEEEMFFPAIEKLAGEKGLMEGNVEQHDQFEPGLEALSKFATETAVKDYEPDKLRSIIESFGEGLREHLRDEIKTLLDLNHLDSVDLKKCWNDTHQYAIKTCNPHVQLPFLMKSMDRTYEGGAFGFECPWFLFYIVDFHYARKYSSVWRFMPCTTRGHPKPLPFATKLNPAYVS